MTDVLSALRREIAEVVDQRLNGRPTAGQFEQIAYSPAQAAGAMGISRSVVYELIAAGVIEARKLGKRTLITRDELERFVAGLPVREPS